MPAGPHDLDDLIRLTTDEHDLTGTLSISPVGDPGSISADTLEATLKGRGVRDAFIDADALRRLVDRVHAQPRQDHEAVVARGHAPTHGEDAGYELADEIAQQAERIEARRDQLKEGVIPDAPDPDGADIDYYDQSAFIIVREGDVLGEAIPGPEHEDGTDLFGNSIPARAGASPESLVDESVRIDDDGRLIASVSGRLRMVPDGLRIERTLHIAEDVDFSTGRIDFPGGVVVKGAVRDHFNIRAEGDIEIGGLVESARLETTGSLTIKSGMAGKSTGRLVVAADLDAGYLERTLGTVHGNATVRRELTMCDIDVFGRLEAESAVVRGGELRLSRGGTVSVLGSVQGVETSIVVGTIPRLEALCRRIWEYGGRIEDVIRDEQERLDALKRTAPRPSPEQIESQMAMQYTIDELSSRGRKLTEAEAAIRAQIAENAEPVLTVRRAIHAKVSIILPGYKALFERDLEGESVIDSGDSGEPRITRRGSTTPLREVARVTSDDRVPRIEAPRDPSRLAS